MKCFGIRKVFAVEYEMIDAISGYFEMWVDNKAVCQYEKNSTEWKYEWNLLYIVEWLSKNLTSILCEVEFPLPVSANSSIDFLNKSNEFDSDDIDEFERWFEKRQDWYFRHSWYSSRGGSYLADVIFRRVADTIEIEWDNLDLYKEITFINPKGLYYINSNLFEQVIHDFIEDFMAENINE